MNPVMSAATGDGPFDLILKNARFVNVYTEEIYPADIGVAGGRVALVTQPGEAGLDGPAVYDCAGKYALPGLIDTHVHIESGMMTPANFARAVVPRGTTTVLADPHEFCNVLGVDGMRYCAAASRGILLRVLLAVPSCVPSVPGAESSRMVFAPEDVADMLAMPEAAALGEVMDYMGVVRQDPRMMAIVGEGVRSGKLIQGHVIGVSPRELAAYRIAGVESDHESRDAGEALVKLRAGMVLECRNGSSAHNLPAMAEALAAAGYPVNATLCTDDREPDDLLREGHMDAAVRAAIRAGVPPIKAVQMATRNAALFLGLKDRGALRPGALADVVLVDGLESFSVRAVFVGGVHCAEEGRLLADIPEPETGYGARNTMNVRREPRREDFLVAAPGSEVLLNAISVADGDPFRSVAKKARFAVRDGFADIGGAENFVAMAVVERHNATGNLALAPVENIGLVRGAVAGTVAHDCHNLFVFGKNAEDMAAAAAHLVRSGGGFAVAEGGRVVAEIRLPVCGLVSDRPAAGIAAEVAAMKEVLAGLGVRGESPVHFLTWFCLAVLPEVRLTDRGLIDTVAQRPLPLFAREDP